MLALNSQNDPTITLRLLYDWLFVFFSARKPIAFLRRCYIMFYTIISSCTDFTVFRVSELITTKESRAFFHLARSLSRPFCLTGATPASKPECTERQTLVILAVGKTD